MAKHFFLKLGSGWKILGLTLSSRGTISMSGDKRVDNHIWSSSRCIHCKLEIFPLSLKRSLQSPYYLFPALFVNHLFIMLAKYRLSSVCKEIIMKAKVCQKVTSKWLEACDFQYCVLRKCQEWYILMSMCTEGLFSFSD